MSRLLHKPVTWAITAVVGLATAGALYWFAPWRAFTDTTVAEPLSEVPSATSTASPAPAGPVVVAEGSFITHEHDTSGTARLVRAPDGSHRLEIAGLNTSDGPDLRVWLSDQQVKTGVAGWRVFDDGKHAELGRLKGNHGDQVYELGPGTDPATFRSVTIWCKRFAVSFGAAELAPLPG